MERTMVGWHPPGEPAQRAGNERRWRDADRRSTLRLVSNRSSEVVVLFALCFGSASGCGPELGPVIPHVVSGYYRAASIESDDACQMGGLWSTDVAVAYSREGFEALYAGAVPIRADAEFVEVPEPTRELEPSPEEPPEREPWKMRRLAWTSASYELEAHFEITFCEDYRHTWSAVPLDEKTFHVTREGTGCGPGDGQSRLCDNRIDIEYELVDACQEPCEFVDDRETRFPGVDLEDIILHDSRCEC
jgi:hypothetical protein